MGSGRWVGWSLVAALWGVAAGSAGAAVVLSTDFDGRTVSGATASNLNWTAQGVVAPGSLTAVRSAPGTPSAVLFNTAAASNRFAVDLNLHTESAWHADIALQVLANTEIDLGAITLDAFIFNNAGALQGVYRDLDMTLQLLDSTQSVLDQASFSDIYAGNGSPALQPVALSFDLSGNTLLANTSYTLRLMAMGQGPGNNSGIDNLVVQGDLRAVPEPASLALVLAAVCGLAVTRRRQSA
jgi:hypothetical protein